MDYKDIVATKALGEIAALYPVSEDFFINYNLLGLPQELTLDCALAFADENFLMEFGLDPVGASQSISCNSCRRWRRRAKAAGRSAASRYWEERTSWASLKNVALSIIRGRGHKRCRAHRLGKEPAVGGYRMPRPGGGTRPPDGRYWSTIAHSPRKNASEWTASWSRSCRRT